MNLILASKSPTRAELLRKLGVSFTVQPADVNESPLKNESPLAYVKRIAMAKAAVVAAANPGSVVLAADTPVILGRRILQTPATVEEAAAMLKLQSGRRVRVPTVVVVAANGKLKVKMVESWLKMKRLTAAEISAYLAAGNWHTAGGLCIERCNHWFPMLQGSVTGIMGLPLYETALMLENAGIKTQPYKGVE